MPDSEATIETIVGQCVEIEQKPGSEWVKFNIDVGSNYPIGLSTRMEKIIEEARAVGSEVATWTFKQKQGKENPNKPGTYYMDRWLNKVELGSNGSRPENTAGGTAPAQQPTQQTSQVPTPHHDAIAPADKDRAIVRQTCLKAASVVYEGLGATEKIAQPADDGLLGEDPAVAAVIAAATRFEIWIYRDITEVPF